MFHARSHALGKRGNATRTNDGKGRQTKGSGGCCPRHQWGKIGSPRIAAANKPALAASPFVSFVRFAGKLSRSGLTALRAAHFKYWETKIAEAWEANAQNIKARGEAPRTAPQHLHRPERGGTLLGHPAYKSVRKAKAARSAHPRGLHGPSQRRPTPKDAPKDAFELSDRLLPPNDTWAVGPKFPSSSARKKAKSD